MKGVSSFVIFLFDLAFIKLVMQRNIKNTHNLLFYFIFSFLCTDPLRSYQI
jgi:hypothetical protein